MFLTLYYIEIEEILLKHKKETFLLSEKLNIRTGCPEVVEWVSILGDMEELTGKGAEQHALGLLKHEQMLGQMVPPSLSDSTIW